MDQRDRTRAGRLVAPSRLLQRADAIDVKPRQGQGERVQLHSRVQSRLRSHRVLGGRRGARLVSSHRQLLRPTSVLLSR